MSQETVTFKSKPDSTNQSTKNTITIGKDIKLTLADVKYVAQNNAPVMLSTESTASMQQSKDFLQRCIDEYMPVYGVNTNFGDQVGFIDNNLKNKAEPPCYEEIGMRQENLIRSMACSTGNILPLEMVRAAMLLRAHCLSQGYSGVSTEVVNSLINFLNKRVTPIVRQYGSIGASGDLIPLASIAACLIGESADVHYFGSVTKTTVAMYETGIKKLELELRDGLALANGTSFMTGVASLAVYNLKRLFRQMLSAIAMSLESMLVIGSGYHPLVHQLKNQSGEIIVNNFLKEFWCDSNLVSSLETLRNAAITNNNTTTPVRSVQDYYSLRSVAQGFGPFHENLENAVVWIENEMNSVNDNPIIDAANREIHHGANFMGYYVTNSCDILKMDISQASTWLHALLANMLHPRKSQQLPANLVQKPEKNNGFRSLQILAASLTVQNRKLAQSHQAYTFPTEGDNQDVYSLGTHAAQDLQDAINNLEKLTAILFLAAAQALEFRGIENASSKAQTIYKIIRGKSRTLTDCRPMSEDMHIITKLLAQEEI